jgi:hypothetical protein
VIEHADMSDDLRKAHDDLSTQTITIKMLQTTMSVLPEQVVADLGGADEVNATIGYLMAMAKYALLFAEMSHHVDDREYIEKVLRHNAAANRDLIGKLLERIP